MVTFAHLSNPQGLAGAWAKRFGKKALNRGRAIREALDSRREEWGASPPGKIVFEMDWSPYKFFLPGKRHRILALIPDRHQLNQFRKAEGILGLKVWGTYATDNAYGFLALSEDRKRKALLVTEIQSDLNAPNGAGRNSRIAFRNQHGEEYRNWSVALLLAAVQRAQEKGYRLFVTTPQHHRKLHYGEQPINFEALYGRTVNYAVRLLGVRKRRALVEELGAAGGLIRDRYVWEIPVPEKLRAVPRRITTATIKRA